MFRDFSELRRFSDSVALVEATGREVRYSELADRCAAFAPQFGPGRQLILLQAANDLASVVAYLAALGSGHVVILTGESSDHARIVREFAPTAIVTGGAVQRMPDVSAPELHPDLALLLPTSGSTGSPKLVRLSHDNLTSNAQSIVEYLGIRPDDRAITSLPFHYSFGMSVLNSHLAAGARVVLTDMSVTNPDFWRLFEATGATSLAGVPYSYELFERTGLRKDPPKSLRTMTQAGGRLAPDLVKAYAEFGARAGVRFFTMYGQTEASPRMAYLPPEKAAANPDCIGLPIPGGAFRLVDDDGREIADAEVSGELVYRGPNVMMGYAFGREDLAKGAELDELRTGDLAVRTGQGLYRIVGRASRFVKIAGLRVGLDDVEAMLAETGRRSVVGGSDAGVVIGVLDGTDPVAVREFIASQCRLPIAAVRAVPLDEAPRLASGKVDYRALIGLGEAQAAKERQQMTGGGPIARAFAQALGVPIPSPEASFTGLGGDSLAYVNASIAIERELGHLPLGWEQMPISSLEAMVGEAPASRSGISWISSELVVRVTALSFILTRHVSLGGFDFLLGGSNVLFALAGYNLARFQGPSLLKGSVKGAITGALYRVVLPYLVVMAAMLSVSKADKSLSWPLLLSVYFVDTRGPLWIYWFIESLFHALLITCALFLIPAFRRFSAERPFGSAMAMIAAAAAVMVVGPHIWNDGLSWHLTIDAWLYAYFIGWAAFMARETWQKLLVLALAGGLTAFQHDLSNSRAIWLVIGLAIVMFIPRIKAPALLNKMILGIAASSYFIYLVHIVPIHFLVREWKITPYDAINIPLLLLISVLCGLAYAWAWRLVTPRIADVARPLLGGSRRPAVGRAPPSV